MSSREEIDCPTSIRMGRKIFDWYDVKVENFVVLNYDKKAIADKNPQITFPVAISKCIVF